MYNGITIPVLECQLDDDGELVIVSDIDVSFVTDPECPSTVIFCVPIVADEFVSIVSVDVT